MIDGRRSFGSAPACQCGFGIPAHCHPGSCLCRPCKWSRTNGRSGAATNTHGERKGRRPGQIGPYQECRSPSLAWILVEAGWILVAPLAQSWRGRREMPSRQRKIEFKLKAIPVATVIEYSIAVLPHNSLYRLLEGRTWNGKPPPRCVVQAASERSSLEILTTLNAWTGKQPATAFSRICPQQAVKQPPQMNHLHPGAGWCRSMGLGVPVS
jgi:hypothetical protein